LGHRLVAAAGDVGRRKRGLAAAGAEGAMSATGLLQDAIF
jgi:hypothetical protein